MTKEHLLKVHPTFFEAILDGRKPFEVRRNDRDFAVGDTLRLREWELADEVFTGRECRRAVTYMLTSGFLGLEPGYVVLGIPVCAPSLRRRAREARMAADLPIPPHLREAVQAVLRGEAVVMPKSATAKLIAPWAAYFLGHNEDDTRPRVFLGWQRAYRAMLAASPYATAAEEQSK